MIRVLPPDVVNQIAAGEVIERPFSVVKELVENSLDAGARRVRIELKEGGLAAIRVIDDGGGFVPEDLPLAFASHATSKLASVTDLDHIASLGFRGEALASIGSVARVTIKSRRHEADVGAEIACEGGVLSPVRPCGVPPGSTIEVRELFFNTPARRKFLRTPQAERARIQDLMARLALAHLDVDFTLCVEGRDALRLPAGESLRHRFARAFGHELGRGLVDVRHAVGDHVVAGVVAGPDFARRDSTLEFLFVNGRVARDRTVTFAVRQAFRDFLMPGRYPVYALHLSLPPHEVDVNVHPTKAEVRFADERRIGGLLHAAAQQALAGTGRTAEAAGLGVGRDRPKASSGFPDLPRDLFARPLSAAPTPPSTAAASAAAEVREVPPSEPRGPAAFPAAARAVPEVLQVRDLYLLFEGEQGLVVVDQHALHERVIYEQLRQRGQGQPAAVQRLLVPEIIELPAQDKAYVLAAQATLRQEGFLVEDFGGVAVAVHGVPAVLTRASPRAILETFLLGRGLGERETAADLVAERFHSMACRAAVMSGDRLTPQESEALLAQASRLQHPHNCPHGRPTTLTFTWSELERYFRRRP
ncbi:MAG: DNA mismatch repair endonuclease MutL [Planctomycetota bacterium]